MKNQKGAASLVVVISIVIVAIVAGYFAFKKSATNQPPQEVFKTQEECENKTGKSCLAQLCDYKCPKDFKGGWVPNLNLSTADETTNWQTYRNEKYGFEFKYPKEWTIASDSEVNDVLGGHSAVTLSQGSSSEKISVGVFGVDINRPEFLVHSNYGKTTSRIGSITATTFDTESDVTGERYKQTVYSLGSRIFILKAPESLSNQVLLTFKFF